jgi:hypothetical protein
MCLEKRRSLPICERKFWELIPTFCAKNFHTSQLHSLLLPPKRAKLQQIFLVADDERFTEFFPFRLYHTNMGRSLFDFDDTLKILDFGRA